MLRTIVPITRFRTGKTVCCSRRRFDIVCSDNILVVSAHDTTVATFADVDPELCNQPITVRFSRL
ncbi:hypothetical protein C448_04926 [Halococcus morrhuae DSM 1307]|uniref:Uncharacterized protein n=1 Tax=Halococcus morrhuae DSM 1307 TaxID=931277 RepID=M0MPG8_HALMO|nr:hypothetical protein C448_04926 [Halococcus morrhuae DSM 1307]